MLDALAEGYSVEVPALWPLEVANALTVLWRRRKLTENEFRAAVEMIRGLPVTIDNEAATIALTRLVEIALEHSVSLYDAAYLELARRRRLPLASKDGSMNKAAADFGVRPWTSDKR